MFFSPDGKIFEYRGQGNTFHGKKKTLLTNHWTDWSGHSECHLGKIINLDISRFLLGEKFRDGKIIVAGPIRKKSSQLNESL